MSTTEEVQHTPEPWEAKPQHTTAYGTPIHTVQPNGRDEYDHIANVFGEANARRIAAAVNACAGIPTEALEGGVVAELLARCKDARIIMSVYATPADKTIAAIEATIAKAEGRDHA